MGVGRLCMLFGKSRQAYYERKEFFSYREQEILIVLELVEGVRRELPGLGIHKLYWMLRNPLRSHGIKMGRDRLNALLRNHNLLIRKRKRVPKTTDSRHWLKKYPNLIKDLEINQIEQVWVSDITYICVGYDFNYLFLITDAYSKKIVGYHLHTLLANDGALLALEVALKNRTRKDNNIIHHSDRGVQYCSFDYVRTLLENNISISLTQNGNPYENAIAERVNGILKTEFKLNRLFRIRSEAVMAVEKSIAAYNLKRPHMSCDYLTPEEAHQGQLKLVKRWKPKKPKQTMANQETETTANSEK
jgi:putative transposase